LVSDAPPLSLYIHIPWCERKCPYCDFNSHEGFDPAIEDDYCHALLADLDSQQAWAQGRPLHSVFIGGGTPSLFSADAIGRILDGVAQRLTLSATTEITLESNPGSAEADRYRGYRDVGVNRLSIGVQSFADECLKQLGRVHNRDQALRAIDHARNAGFDRYNIDLMHGLPGQSPEMAERDLEQALAVHGGHLSWYQLTIEPNTKFYRERPLLPVEDALADIQDRGEARLAAAGFGHYEVSAFSLPSQESAHNLNYWQFGDYLAIGAGAHGKVTDEGGVWRFQRTRAPRDYLNAVLKREPQAVTPERRRLDDDLLAGEFMLNALRLREGVSASLLTQRTGLDWQVVSPIVEECIDRGLMSADTQRLATTELGFRFLNDVVGRFIRE
jgi:oxygen-independent coproporphyrinogen-3 oxidase